MASAYMGIPVSNEQQRPLFTTHYHLNPSDCTCHLVDDNFFASGNAPRRCCCNWLLSFLRCLLAPLGWISCWGCALYQCFTWSCPQKRSLWDFTIYLLRFVAYASTGFRDGTLQAIVDLATIAGPILSIWLGKGVSRCQVSETLQPIETLGGRGEWLWPKGETTTPNPHTHPRSPPSSPPPPSQVWEGKETRPHLSPKLLRGSSSTCMVEPLFFATVLHTEPSLTSSAAGPTFPSAFLFISVRLASNTLWQSTR